MMPKYQQKYQTSTITTFDSDIFTNDLVDAKLKEKKVA